ncbi:MAG: hypothetical protein WA708_12630 [Acidobacteriaceae bacterium]
MRVLCTKDFLETETRRALARAKQSRAVPAGRGKSTERVTGGEQGKYGRIGDLWKHPADGQLYKGVPATGQQWNHVLSFAMYPAAKAGIA